MVERGICDDSISSIKVPQGYTVIAYENADFGGSSITFTNNMENLGDSWNAKISSFEVKRNR